jgi:hypothetical protein
MSEYELIVQLTQALAWPVFALTIVLILRRPIRQMLTQRPMSKLKAGPFEVEWDKMMSQAEAEVGRPAPPGIPGGVRTELRAEAEADPSVAILAAHTAVDRALRVILSATDLPTSEINLAGSTVGLARLAREQGLISAKSLQAVEGITVMRNLAAHGSAREITTEQAEEYLALVDAILYALRSGAPGP